jgi:hypothetical protein
MSDFAQFRRLCLAFAMAILACGTAAADTLLVTGTGTGGNIWVKANGTVEQAFAGLIDIRVTNSTGTYNQDTYCVQILTDISTNITYNTTVELPSQVNWNPAPPSNAELQQVAWLIDNYQASANTATLSEALQLAVWKISEDGVYTYVAGVDPYLSGIVQESTTRNETTNATVLTDARTYLQDASGHTSNLANVYINTTQANPPVAAQMLEGIRYADTPESSTFMLAGVALLALGHRVRRRAS